MTDKQICDKELHDIGVQLAQARHARGEMIEAAALANGLDRSVLSLIEKGHHESVTYTTLLRLYVYYGLPLTGLPGREYISP